MKNRKHSIFKIFLAILILFGGISGGYKLYDTFKEKDLVHHLYKRISQTNEKLDTWIKFSPEGDAFSVLFPKKPEYIIREFPIPRSDDTLPYHEYQSSDNLIVASVSYTILPDDWATWTPSLVLKGALKVVMNTMKQAHLVGTSSNTIKSYPALDFEHYLGDQETAGTLILVGNILYKIEIIYPLSERESAHHKLCQFIESFAPAEIKKLEEERDTP